MKGEFSNIEKTRFPWRLLCRIRVDNTHTTLQRSDELPPEKVDLKKALCPLEGGVPFPNSVCFYAFKYFSVSIQFFYKETKILFNTSVSYTSRQFSYATTSYTMKRKPIIPGFFFSIDYLLKEEKVFRNGSTKDLKKSLSALLQNLSMPSARLQGLHTLSSPIETPWISSIENRRSFRSYK